MRYLLFFSLILAKLASAQTVTILADKWFPINGEPGAENPGYMIEIAQKIFPAVDYKVVPWLRAIEEVNAGRADCIVGTDKTITPGYIFPEESWGEFRDGVYTNANDDWQYTGIQSLLERKVGLMHGYSYEGLDGLIPTRKDVFQLTSGSEGLARNFKQLFTKRINTIIENTAVASNKLYEMDISHQIRLAGYLDDATPAYIACSSVKPGSLELIRRIDEGTRQLRASGELEKILNSYGLTDWK